MNAISGVKDLFHSSVSLLNRPIIKECVISVAGSVTFAFGLIEIYDVYHILKDRKISIEGSKDTPQWVQVANKIIIVCAKISLILSAGVTRPGVFIISSLTGCFFSTAQLERVFGPNTIFAINPWHPRHVVSIAAVILALPSIAQMSYRVIRWVICSNSVKENHEAQNWLTDTKIRFMTLFNIVTCRPTLHLGNRLSQQILRSK